MSKASSDHALCARMLARSGSSFTLPIRLLPEAKRRGTTALYAFCRRADDIVDDAVDTEAARASLAAFAGDLDDALGGQPGHDPVIRAVVDTARRHAVPHDSLRDILAGVRMDLDRSGYDTLAQLEDYCRHVASAVGIASIHVWGFREPERALPAAHACGLAFQLTNILRDIPEDLARGRLYLPREDFEQTGCDPDDLRAGRIGAEFARLLDVNVTRAEAWYQRAERLDAVLSTDGRLAFRAMTGAYRTILAAVRRSGVRIFTARVRPHAGRVTAAALVTLLAGPRWLRASGQVVPAVRRPPSSVPNVRTQADTAP